MTNFFGHKSKHRSLHTIPGTVKDCEKAMKLHSTRYGRLRKHSHVEWQTHTPDSYSCKWMTSRRRMYTHSKMIAYPARLSGNNKYIQQHLTHAHCQYSTRHCHPREMTKSQIVWHHIKHDSRLYHSLGNYKVHQLDKYILVASISVSGTIMSTRDNSAVLILDSGYIVVQSAFINGTLHQVENHINQFKFIGYVFNQQNKRDVEDNRFQCYLLITNLLAALLEHERADMIRAWENICG